MKSCFRNRFFQICIFTEAADDKGWLFLRFSEKSKAVTPFKE